MFSVIIPTYNNHKLLKSCLQSLYKSKSFHKLVKEIIIIDNGSDRNLPKLISNLNLNFQKKTQQETSQNSALIPKVITNQENLGFAQAVNQGWSAAKSKYVVVLNNDIRLDSNWFIKMEKAIGSAGDSSTIAAWFGKVMNNNGSAIESTGLKFFLKGKANNRQDNHADKFILGPPASTAVYKRSMLNKLSGFDERFFAYEEDVDLALRLYRDNYKCAYTAEAISYHLGQATSNKMGNFKQKMDYKNWVFIVIKHYPLSILVKNFPVIFLERLKNLSGLIKATKFSHLIPTLINIHWEIIKNVSSVLRDREPIAAKKFNNIAN